MVRLVTTPDCFVASHSPVLQRLNGTKGGIFSLSLKNKLKRHPGHGRFCFLFFTWITGQTKMMWSHVKVFPLQQNNHTQIKYHQQLTVTKHITSTCHVLWPVSQTQRPEDSSSLSHSFEQSGSYSLYKQQMPMCTPTAATADQTERQHVLGKSNELCFFSSG